MSDYYILSLDKTNDMLVWWGENNSGYTSRLDKAGKYSKQKVKENIPYYDNGKLTRAISCEEVDNIAIKCVPNDVGIFEKLKVQYPKNI